MDRSTQSARPVAPEATTSPRATPVLDEPAFARVYEAHAPAVFAVVARIAGDAGAEDATQETFLRLWRDPDRYDPARGSLRTYLITIARHVAIDQIRSDRARDRREGRDARRLLLAPPLPEDAAVRSVTADRIVEALERLSVDTREAIVMAFFGGLTYTQVADALGVPTGTIKSRIRSGLFLLRADLRDA